MRRALALVWLLASLSLAALGQAYTTVTASNVTVDNGSGSAVNPPSGSSLCFLGVNNSGAPITYTPSGGSPVSGTVCQTLNGSGALTGTLQVANPATAAPLGLLYTITVVNGGTTYLTIPTVSLSGTVWSFDSFALGSTGTALGIGKAHLACSNGAQWTSTTLPPGQQNQRCNTSGLWDSYPPANYCPAGMAYLIPQQGGTPMCVSPTFEGNGAPTGSCFEKATYLDLTSNNFYVCGNAAWHLAGGSGGGGNVVTAINGAYGSFNFTGPGVNCSGTTCNFPGAVFSLNSLTGAVSLFGDGMMSVEPVGSTSIYLHPLQTAIGYAPFDSLVGAFTDSSGNVIEPVYLGDGPSVFAVPPGATQLQMGVNDTDYTANGGSWVISVNGTHYTVAGTTTPWSTSSINTQFPIGASAATSPVVVPISNIHETVTVQYISGTVTDGPMAWCGGVSPSVDASGLSGCTPILGATGAKSPGYWTSFPSSSSTNGITALNGDVTATGPGSATATLAPSGVGAGSYTSANITVDAKGRVTAASNGTGSGFTAGGDLSGTSTSQTVIGLESKPLPALSVGNLHYDGSSLSWTPGGGGTSDPTTINLTASPYNGSPYGATTTTGTFSASATSGTVASCSTFAAGNGVYIVGGGGSGAWNGTAYVGQVVSCSGTTMTITPAITNSVSGAVVQHDETAAINAAVTALSTLGGQINFPNAALNTQGVYLVNGALQDTSGANAIIPMPKIANYSQQITNITFAANISGADAPPIIRTALTTSGANLIGGYDSATGGGFPNFTNVGLYIRNLIINGPQVGSATIVNGQWLLQLEFSGQSRVTTFPFSTTQTVAAGNGVIFPTTANNVYVGAPSDLNVAGFANCIQAGEHTQFNHVLVTACTNGFVADTPQSTPAQSITVNQLWCGPPVGALGSASTVVNCIVGGADSTTVNIGLADYEGTGTLVNDVSNNLHGKIGYSLVQQSCPTNATVSGATNVVLSNLKCSSGGVATATQGSTTANHLAVFGSNLHDIVDGGPVPSGGGGAMTNITSTVTATGCTVTGGVCSVGTPGNAVTFSSIPGTYNEIIIIVQSRVSDSANSKDMALNFNSDTGNNYNGELHYGQGSSTTGVVSYAGQTSQQGILLVAASAAANISSYIKIDIPFYASTAFYHNYHVSSGSPVVASFFQTQELEAQWNSTSAITSIKMSDGGGGNFVAGSNFIIYGVN